VEQGCCGVDLGSVQSKIIAIRLNSIPSVLVVADCPIGFFADIHTTPSMIVKNCAGFDGEGVQEEDIDRFSIENMKKNKKQIII